MEDYMKFSIIILSVVAVGLFIFIFSMNGGDNRTPSDNISDSVSFPNDFEDLHSETLSSLGNSYSYSYVVSYNDVGDSYSYSYSKQGDKYYNSVVSLGRKYGYYYDGGFYYQNNEGVWYMRQSEEVGNSPDNTFHIIEISNLELSNMSRSSGNTYTGDVSYNSMRSGDAVVSLTDEGNLKSLEFTNFEFNKQGRRRLVGSVSIKLDIKRETDLTAPDWVDPLRDEPLGKRVYLEN